MSDRVLTVSPEGLYCPAGDFHIDPWRPVARALITHGHADHARPGHKSYLATPATAPVMRHRLGAINVQTQEFGAPLQIGEARVSFHPAGHVPGSAQIRVEVDGETWVVSGDYKLESDGISEAFEHVRCHTFISECTFGLPVFKWPAQVETMHAINGWWRACAADGVTPVLGAYSLGKAQRILAHLDTGIGPILTHGAVEATNGVLRAQGIALPLTVPVTPDTKGRDHPGAIVLAPPAALGSPWMRRFGKTSTGFASGWMAMRGVRRRRAGDRGFVLSDHADWEGLNRAIRDTGAERVLVTHGYTSVFRRWLQSEGFDAAVLETEFEGESIDRADGEEIA